MRIVHVVGAFYPAIAYGGPVEANRALSRELARLGAETKVLTTNMNGPRKLGSEFAGWRRLDGYDVFYANRWLWHDLAPTLAIEIERQVPQADVVHVTATYTWWFPIVARACRRYGRPLVVSPRASLLPEARANQALKKRVFDALIHKRSLGRVTAFHATSESEAAALRAVVVGARVVVVPNGVDVPDVLPDKGSTASPYLLYLGRLNPYKRIDRIVRAFARVVSSESGQSSAARGWSLTIAGDGEPSYRRDLDRLVEITGMTSRVRFLGHVAGEEKERVLAQAGAVVQAPNPENFGNVVAEALARATPVLVGKGLPWAALDQERCGFWVDDSEESLANGMRRLMALTPEERLAMGQRGRRWMARDFSWDRMARRMLALYEELLASKPR
jgi:glycosyltransferase involved in cell wall biosynthesis